MTAKPNETYWPSIYVATITQLLIGLQFSILCRLCGPFSRRYVLDENADTSFLGYIIAAFSVGQFFTSPVYGYIGNKIKTIRYPCAFGAALQLSANLIFANAELFTYNRRWVLFCTRLLLGIGAGNVSLYRAYIATGSTVKDRPKAIAISSGAFNIGMIIGPGLQVAYTGIGYPGYVSNGFHLNTYTAAAYTCALANICVIITLLFIFREHYCAIELDEGMKMVSKNCVSAPKSHPVFQFDIVPVVVLILAWAVQMFVVTNGEALNSPFSMVMFNWSQEEAVQYCGLIQVGSGIAVIIVYIAIGNFLYPMINERHVLILGFSMLFMFYVVSFSWPGLPVIEPLTANASLPIPSPSASPSVTLSSTAHKASPTHVNSTTVRPCSDLYSWCHTTPRVSLGQYLAGWIFQAFGFPCATIVVMTLYSRVLGPQRQGTMQGIYITAGSASRAVGPVIIGNLFEKYGPQPPWLMMMIMVFFTIILFCLTYKRLVGFGERTGRKWSRISKISVVERQTSAVDLIERYPSMSVERF